MKGGTRTLERMMKIAKENDILIVDMHMNGKEGAMSQSIDGMCIVAIDPHKIASAADRKEKTAHELGHCMTGSFYDENCPVVPRGRCERRAVVWSVRNTVSKRAIMNALHSGLTEVWQLAEHFEVTEHVMIDALVYYGLYSA